MAHKETVSPISRLENTFDLYCQFCLDHKKHVEADGFCINCDEYLCGPCYNAHSLSRYTEEHKLQDKDSMPKPDRVSKSISTTCKFHTKPVEYYCRSDAFLGCSTCFAEGHKSCSDIETIVDVSEGILANPEFKDFLSQLRSMQIKSNELLSHARENKTLSVNCFEDIVSSVRQLKEGAIEKLNAFEQDIIADAEKINKEDAKKIDSVIDKCDAMSGKINHMSSEIESPKVLKRVCQMYINMRERQDEVKSIHSCLEELEGENVVRTFRFDPNPDLPYVLERSDVLGKVNTEPCSPKNSSQPVSQHASVVSVGRMTSSHVADINVKSNGDENPCSITGSTVVSEDRILLADHRNDKIKMVDARSHMLLCELKLQSSPWDATAMGTNQAAVTLPFSKRILFMLAELDTLSLQNMITTGGECRGIAYSQDKLIVTFVDSPHVEIIDLQGRVLKRIENRSDGRTLFEYPQYACISKDGKAIYVSDERGGTITKLTFDGQVKSVYRDEELSDPKKACTDQYGVVYVLSNNDRSLHMITENCMKIKVILNRRDGLEGGYSVSHWHDEDTTKLFIGMWYNDNIKVFQLVLS